MSTALVNSRGAASQMPRGAHPVGRTNQPLGTRHAGVGVDYVGHTRCMANDATCQGPRALGTEFCVGHLKSFAKQGEVTDASQ